MNETCLRCNAKSYVRGLCQACYATAYRHVRKGVFTWADLEKRGFAKPARPRGPRILTLDGFCQRKDNP